MGMVSDSSLSPSSSPSPPNPSESPALKYILNWPVAPHLCCHHSGPGHPISPGASYLVFPPSSPLSTSCQSEHVTSSLALSPSKVPYPEGNLIPPMAHRDLHGQDLAQLSAVISIRSPRSKSSSPVCFPSFSRIPKPLLTQSLHAMVLLLPPMLSCWLSVGCLLPSHPSNLSLIVTATDRPPSTPVGFHPHRHKCHFQHFPNNLLPLSFPC